MSTPKRKSSKLPGKRPGPAGGKRDRTRRENRRRLADAALGLFLAHGTAAVTIDQIVEAAAMAKGSFYRYARDKQVLIEQIMQPVVTEVTAALERCEHALGGARRDTLAATYVALATELAVVVTHHGPRVLLYLQEARAPSGSARRAIHGLAEQLAARAVILTRVARDHGLIRAVDPTVSALIVLGAVDGILFAALRRQRPPAADTPAADTPAADTPKVIAELVGIVLRGIGG